MSDEKLLEVVDLQAGYNGMAVVHDVSFSVREGEILAILGSNGSGKTTTLRAITGTIKPIDRKSTRLNSSHITRSRMPSSA